MNIKNIYMQLFGRKGPSIGSDIDMAEHGRAGGISTGQAFKHVQDHSDLRHVDDVGDAGTTIYLGYGAVGRTNDTDQAIWKIVKLEVAGGAVGMFRADGDDEYDNVWDNRASLTYL